jgi:hypothetical protein
MESIEDHRDLGFGNAGIVDTQDGVGKYTAFQMEVHNPATAVRDYRGRTARRTRRGRRVLKDPRTK